MFKLISIVLVVLWIFTVLITGITIHRQFQISKLQMRILDDYKQLSTVDFIFKTARDSIQQDIERTDKLLKELKEPASKQIIFMNWMFIRALAIFLTILTIVAFWFYYRKKAKE